MCRISLSKGAFWGLALLLAAKTGLAGGFFPASTSDPTSPRGYGRLYIYNDGASYTLYGPFYPHEYENGIHLRFQYEEEIANQWNIVGIQTFPYKEQSDTQIETFEAPLESTSDSWGNYWLMDPTDWTPSGTWPDDDDGFLYNEQHYFARSNHTATLEDRPEDMDGYVVRVSSVGTPAPIIILVTQQQNKAMASSTALEKTNLERWSRDYDWYNY